MFHLVSQGVLFISILVLLVSHKQSIVGRVLSILPIEQATKDKIENEWVINTYSIAKGLFQITLCNCLVCWMVFDFLHIKFKYTSAIIMGFAGLFPLIPAWVCYIPSIFYLITIGKYFESAFLSLVAFFVINAIYAGIIESTS